MNALKTRIAPIAAAGTYLVMTTAANAQVAGNSSDAFTGGYDPSTKLALVVGGVLALIGLIAAASIGIEIFWKGHQKAKQTVKKL